MDCGENICTHTKNTRTKQQETHVEIKCWDRFYVYNKILNEILNLIPKKRKNNKQPKWMTEWLTTNGLKRNKKKSPTNTVNTQKQNSKPLTRKKEQKLRSANYQLNDWKTDNETNKKDTGGQVNATVHIKQTPKNRILNLIPEKKKRKKHTPQTTNRITKISTKQNAPATQMQNLNNNETKNEEKQKREIHHHNNNNKKLSTRQKATITPQKQQVEL